MTTTTMRAESRRVLDRLAALRAQDAPTHGGRVLSYVYDSGLAELDELAAEAMRAVQPVNALDPTTFGSVAVMERELIAFGRRMLHGESAGVVGNVTAGGTESCLLVVKTARDRWRAAGGVGTPRLVAPMTAHAAFHKAAELFDLTLESIPVDPLTGALDADRMLAALGPDVALAVVSAPAYPYGCLDPVEAVAAGCAQRGVPCHVDACFGGWILPFWRTSHDGEPPAWDFAVPGVTSISADPHKYGYAPKGVSLLLYRDPDAHRSQYFAVTGWPGYPVVNPTLLGSRPAAPLAAAWAICSVLGTDGFAELAGRCMSAARRLVDAVDAIEGLRVVGEPVGPSLAVAADESVPAERRVDPHRWADAARRDGWILQLQPGLVQPDGSRLPATTHLTVTPVTERVADDLVRALGAAADAVRGLARADAAALLGGLPAAATAQLAGGAGGGALPDTEGAFALLRVIGLAPEGSSTALPDEMAPFLALIEALPNPLTERLLAELLARVVEPG